MQTCQVFGIANSFDCTHSRTPSQVHKNNSHNDALENPATKSTRTTCDVREFQLGLTGCENVCVPLPRLRTDRKETQLDEGGPLVNMLEICLHLCEQFCCWCRTTRPGRASSPCYLSSFFYFIASSLPLSSLFYHWFYARSSLCFFATLSQVSLYHQFSMVGFSLVSLSLFLASCHHSSTSRNRFYNRSSILERRFLSLTERMNTCNQIAWSFARSTRWRIWSSRFHLSPDINFIFCLEFDRNDHLGSYELLSHSVTVTPVTFTKKLH